MKEKILKICYLILIAINTQAIEYNFN